MSPTRERRARKARSQAEAEAPMGAAPVVLWAPHAGPQTHFLQSWAYECLYGGAAGGGKTDALLALLIEQVHHPKYRGLFLRETFAELREAIDRTHEWWPKLGGVYNATDTTWTFPSGATVELGYFQEWKHRTRYQGRQFAVICYDELGNLKEERCWLFLMSRNRAADPGILRFMRGSANPGGAGARWVKRRFIDTCPPDGTLVAIPDREGRAPLTRAFVAAKVEDNPTLLTNDPEYIQRLNMLPEDLRRQQRDGDWSVGNMSALQELSRVAHLIDAFPAPAHWPRIAAFDWGYQHRASFVIGAVDERGAIHVLDSLHLFRKEPNEQASRIRELVARYGLPPVVWAGHDCFAEHKARGDGTPTIADQFLREGIVLTPANIARVAGLNNLRRYLQWMRTGPNGSPGQPMLFVHQSRGNRDLFAVLDDLQLDPNDPEDVLKVDYVPGAVADGEDYEPSVRGDDPYDALRYLCASRPLTARKPEDLPTSAWDPAVLAEQAAEQRRVKATPLRGASGSRVLRSAIEDAEAAW